MVWSGVNGGTGEGCVGLSIQLNYYATLRGSLKRSATIWASGRTRDPYFEILGAPRGIMVTPSGGFDF